MQDEAARPPFGLVERLRGCDTGNKIKIVRLTLIFSHGETE
jgi:hypothetical protein